METFFKTLIVEQLCYKEMQIETRTVVSNDRGNGVLMLVVCLLINCVLSSLLVDKGLYHISVSKHLAFDVCVCISSNITTLSTFPQLIEELDRLYLFISMAVLNKVVVGLLLDEVVCEYISRFKVKEYHVIKLPGNNLLTTDSRKLFE